MYVVGSWWLATGVGCLVSGGGYYKVPTWYVAGRWQVAVAVGQLVVCS